MLDLSEQSTTSSSMLLLPPPIMSSASSQSTLDHCHETMKHFSNQMVPMPAADVLSNNDKTSQSYSRLPQQQQDPSYHRINNNCNNSINNTTTSNGTLIHLPTALIQMSAVATNNRTNILMPQGLMTTGSSQPTRYLRHPPLVSRQSSVTLAPQHHSHHHHHYSQQQQQAIASYHPSSTPHNPNLQGMMPHVSSNNSNNRQQHMHNSQTSVLNNQVQQPPSTPDNQTFIDCMSSMLKYMHQGFNEDPNLKGLLLPPAPVITTAKPKRRRRRSRTLKLGEEEEEIIKQEEREEFQKVLESQFNASAPEEIVKPLPECIGTPFCFNMQQHQLSNHPHHQAERDSSFSATEHLMMILLQYQSFRSFPFYTEDEQGQQEQIKLQKQRRHELMKQKRAIRRERRKEMKNKKRVNDGSHEDSSQNKRARMSLSGAENSVHHTHDESSNHLTDEDEFSLLFNSDQDEESLDGNGGMSLDGFSDEDDDLSDEEDEEDDDSEENDEESNDGIDVDCLPTPINHLLLSPIAPSVFDSSTIDNSNLSVKTSKGFTNLPTPSTADMDFYLTPSSFFAQLPTPIPQLSSQQHSLLTVRSAGTQVSPKTNFNTMFEQTLLHQKSD